MPSVSASWKRKRNFAMNMPRTSGAVVASAPHRNNPAPCVFRPLTKPGPAEMPTTAMKMLRPTVVTNQTVGAGRRQTRRAAPPAAAPAAPPPPPDDPGDERAPSRGQGQRHAADVEHQRAEQGTDHD